MDFQNRDLACLFSLWYTRTFTCEHSNICQILHSNICTYLLKKVGYCISYFLQATNEPFGSWPLIVLGKLNQQHLRPLLSFRIRVLRNLVAPCLPLCAYVKGQVQLLLSEVSTGRFISGSNLLGWPTSDKPWASINRVMLTTLLNLYTSSSCSQSPFLLDEFFKDQNKTKPKPECSY